jgi:hypothetical protein
MLRSFRLQRGFTTTKSARKLFKAVLDVDLKQLPHSANVHFPNMLIGRAS